MIPPLPFVETLVSTLPTLEEAAELLRALEAHMDGSQPLPHKATAELALLVASAAFLRKWGRIRLVPDPPPDPPPQPDVPTG